MARTHEGIAKITRPVIRGAYQRRRLFRLLDRGRERPVIFVSGPPGSGKTTLISSYIDHRKLDCLWYRVDEIDGDLPSFFYYMGLAAKKAAPRRRTPLPALTPEYQMGIPTFTKRYFEDLFSRLRTPSVIVLDNYQEVPADSLFHEVIVNGLSEIPNNINVIVVSRAGPPPDFARVIANDRMELIDYEALRLTPDESMGILRLRSLKVISKETALHFHEGAYGWVAGLVLMERARREGIESDPAGGLSKERIFDYFAGEIFRKADVGIREFLQRTVFLPYMTVHAACALTGLSRAGEILSELHNKNYFTEKRRSAETIYQYHPLFRQFLLSRANKTFSPEEISALQTSAARLLEESGQIEDAAQLFIQAKDWSGLIGLILKHAAVFVSEGRSRIIEEWLGGIPQNIIDDLPWLLYWKGVCRSLFDPKESQGYLEKAFELFKSRRDVAGVYLSWAGIVESIHLAFENFRLLDVCIEQLDGLMKEYGPFPSTQIEAQVSVAMFTAISFRIRKHADFEFWLEKALSLKDLRANIRTHFYLFFYHLVNGRSDKYEVNIEDLQKLVRLPGVTPFDQILVRLAEEMSYIPMGSYSDVLRAADEGLAISEKSGCHLLDFMLMGNASITAFNAGDFKKASGLIERMEPFADALRPWDRAFYHHIVSLEAMFQGDMRKSVKYGETALDLSYQTDSLHSLVWCHIHMAHLMRKIGEETKASEHISSAFSIAERINSNLARFDCYLNKAILAFQRKDEDGPGFLRKGMMLGREHGFVNSFFPWNYPEMSRLCAIALENDIETEYVRQLIRKRNFIPDESCLHVEDWPWQIKLHTLEKFELLRDDKPVSSSGKVQKKPLEMLKALIAFGGKDVREEQISDAIWPDADGDTALISFRTTLHRLRKLVGENAIQYVDEKLTLDRRYCWVDVWAFERILSEAEKQCDNDSQKVSLLEKAMNLYKGHFLHEESDKIWVVKPQERLKARFLAAVERTGELYKEKREWKKAAACYERGLEVDDLEEEFYRELMDCHIKLGKKTGAIKVYHRCKKILNTALGIEPSRETTMVYEDVMKRE